MSDNDVQLTASVQFTSDPASVNAAKSGIESVRASAEGAAAAVKKVKPEPGADQKIAAMGGSAEKAFSSINAASQVAEGGVMGVGSAVKNLAGQFPALNAAMGPVGIALAAFAAWQKVVVSVRESIASLKAGIRAIQSDNFEAQIKREAAAWENLSMAIRRTAEERQMYSNIEQAKDDAEMRSELAKLELEKQQRYAEIAPGDELARRKIDLDISTRRSGLEEAAANRKSDREARNLAAEESTQRQIIAAKKIEEEVLQAQVLKRMGSISGIVNQGVRDSSRWTTSATDEKIWSSIAQETEKLLAKNETDFAKIKQVQEEQYKAKQSIITIQAARDINKVDRNTTDVQSDTRKVTDWITGTGIDAAENAELAGLFERLNETASGNTSAFRNWLRIQLDSQQTTRDLLQQLIAASENNAAHNQAALARARRPGG